MDKERLGGTLELLIHNARLKALPRTGWLMRGVTAPESIAAHSHGVAFVALLLLDLIDESLDRERALAMAILHDLPEAVMGDIPTPATRHFPAGAKTDAETTIFDEMTAGTRSTDLWGALWREFTAAETPEAKLVHDADKLDMFLQAMLYQRSGHGEVARFWERIDSYPWTYPASRELIALMYDLTMES
jgi:putative hydrolases of HD superfamily